MIDKVKRDVCRAELRKGNVQLALCVLFLPRGYALSKQEPR